jgi:hypothetical protein
MPVGLPERIVEALDVSAAFDNCFFHAYALYLIANNRSLPKDLFTFNSILDDSYAAKLQKIVPDENSLFLFAEYSKRHEPNNESLSPNFIVEKTLVLGFLLREWFATHMAEHLEIGSRMTKEVLPQFERYKEFRDYQGAKAFYMRPTKRFWNIIVLAQKRMT